MRVERVRRALGSSEPPGDVGCDVDYVLVWEAAVYALCLLTPTPLPLPSSRLSPAWTPTHRSRSRRS